MASNYNEQHSTELKEGDLLHKDRFKIIKKIGQGGFGFVYCARDNQNKGEK